jgi:gluconolactonase
MRTPAALLALVLLASPARGAEPAAVDVKDKAEFAKVVPGDAKLERLATGMSFTEGPVWFDDADGGFLLFTDIPANQIKRWSAKAGLTVFRDNANYANGNTRDRDGRLVTCEHSARRVTRTEPDGTVTVLIDRYDGKRFNSPNDPVVKSDGTVWFTDPPYGLPKGEAQELDKQYVFRLDPKTKEVKPVAADFDRPNGLAFSPDEKKLYVADSGKPRHVRVFAVNPDNTLSGGDVFCTIDVGAPDGIRTDAAGRLYATAREGVHVFSPAGQLIGKILVPENTANVTFGGKNRDELYITATKSLYRIKLTTTGAQKP